MKTILMLLLCGFNLLAIEPSQKERKEDLDFIKSELPKLHYDLFHTLSEKDFTKEIEDLELKIDSCSDIEFALGIQSILTKIGDSHTNIDYFKYLDRKNTYPIKVYWYKDGFYVIRTLKIYEEILGKKIISINGISIKNIIEKFETIIVKDNEAIIKHRLPNILVFKDILDFLGITNGMENKFSFSNLDEVSELNIKTVAEIDDLSKVVKLKPKTFQQVPFLFHPT